MPVACQGKVAEKMSVAVKSGMSHPPDLIKSFSNHVKNCPESLGEIDKQIKDFFKVESNQLLFSGRFSSKFFTDLKFFDLKTQVYGSL